MRTTSRPSRRSSCTQAPIHPFLFAAYPVAFLYSKNLDLVFPVEVLRPLAVTLGLTALAFALLKLLYRDVTRPALALSVFVALFFAFRHLAGKVDDLGIPGSLVVSLIVLAALVAVLRRRYNAPAFAQFLNFLGLALLLMPLGRIGWHLLAQPHRSPDQVAQSLLAAADAADGPVPALSPRRGYKPDIYYLILDAYGGEEVLREVCGPDTTGLYDYLRAKGFHIVPRGRTNYSQTALSLGSSLNMLHVTSLASVLGSDSEDRRPLLRLLRDNRVCRLLRSAGYRIVKFPAVYSTNDSFPADLTVGGPEPSYFEIELARTTPLPVLDGLVSTLTGGPTLLTHLSKWGLHKLYLRRAFDDLGRVPRHDGPVFVFAHILCPHAPFFFDCEGRDRSPAWWWVSEEECPTPQARAAAYAGQLRYLNGRVREIVDRILATSTRPPIIIIRADHGPQALLDWNHPDQTGLWERMSILNALYLPEGGAQVFYPDLTPVNTFRLVLNYYFGTHYAKLPDTSHFSSIARPYGFLTYDPTRERPPLPPGLGGRPGPSPPAAERQTD